jgi:hypothetical protein
MENNVADVAIIHSVLQKEWRLVLAWEQALVVELEMVLVALVVVLGMVLVASVVGSELAVLLVLVVELELALLK